MKMSDDAVNETTPLENDQTFSRVSNWISTHDFHADKCGIETNLKDNLSDLTSVTKNIERLKCNQNTAKTDGLVVEERTDVIKCGDEQQEVPADTSESAKKNADTPSSSTNDFVKTLSKFSKFSPFDTTRNILHRDALSSTDQRFAVIMEGDEFELPDTKRNEMSLRNIKQTQSMHFNANALASATYQKPVPLPSSAASAVTSRPSSRHKRHADAMTTSSNKASNSVDRKTRKRRTLEKVGASVMLQWFIRASIESFIVGAVLVALDLLLNTDTFHFI